MKKTEESLIRSMESAKRHVADAKERKRATEKDIAETTGRLTDLRKSLDHAVAVQAQHEEMLERAIAAYRTAWMAEESV